MNDTETEAGMPPPMEAPKPQPIKRSKYGTGSIYQKGNSLYIKWSVNGKAFAQSAKTLNPRQAEKLLQAKLAVVENGTHVEPKLERVKVEKLAQLLFGDYKRNGRRSLADVEARWRLHLAPFFAHLYAAQVSTKLIEEYIDQRQAATPKPKNATVNRELAVLSRIFHLAQKASRIARLPMFPERLKENNTRVGFVKDDEYDRLAAACARRGLWLRAIFETAYQLGWRLHELVPEDTKRRQKPGLRVRNVDLAERILRLDPGTTKNGDGREAVMPERLFRLIEQCVLGKKPDDFVFTREGGEPVRDFRGAWKAACREAGVTECHLFHDLRRSSITRMDRRGIPRLVAMQISGHKTDSVYRRYRIVNRGDLRDARRRMEQPLETNSYETATFCPNDGANAQFEAPVANRAAVN